MDQARHNKIVSFIWDIADDVLKDDTQVYKQFVENEAFHRFVTDMVFH